MVVSKDPASFRDPCGFVFRDDDRTLYRQVNRSYEANYRALMDSGLYAELVERELLIEHEEVSTFKALNDDALVVIRPREVPFISYPYEWAFSALKQAALLTLEIQRQALRANMSLKDASSYNVQFEGTRPIFIDTLSFDRYEPGTPWVAYGQFCRHFLAPLTLMSRIDIGLNRLLANYIDGIPLELASGLLPWTTWLKPGTMMHLHLQAMMIKRYSRTSPSNGSEKQIAARRVSPQGLSALIDSLETAVRRLRWRGSSHWTDYYDNNSYSSQDFQEKRRTVAEFLDRTDPRQVWDLGANTGVFSRLASQRHAQTLAFDVDPACVEILFRACMEEGEQNVLPLVLDLANPSPAVGWANRERKSLPERGPADMVLALALIHHLAISCNLPLEHIADYLSELSEYLIIEFVPKHDPQVRRLLRSRQDIFDQYDKASFEAAFRRRFTVIDSRSVEVNGRVLYLMRRN